MPQKVNKNIDKSFVETISKDKDASLYKAKGTPKLIISRSTWMQIQTLLLKYHNTEWSGVLYYTDNESKNVNELVVKAHFLHPMTIGQTAYTSFDWQKKEVKIFEANLLKQGTSWRKGCLHSHHSMGVFFSGEDNKDLKEQALYHYYYVSVIVNNEQEVVARLSHKLTANQVESVFGNVEMGDSVVYYDMEVQLEDSLYQDYFDKGLASMNDMRAKVTYNNSFSFGKQTSLWTSALDNGYQNNYGLLEEPEMDANDIVEFFNIYEIVPTIPPAGVSSLQELDNHLNSLLNTDIVGVSPYDVVLLTAKLWLNEFPDIILEDINRIVDKKYNSIRYLFKTIYSSI